jgi:hypothetical protein
VPRVNPNRNSQPVYFVIDGIQIGISMDMKYREIEPNDQDMRYLRIYYSLKIPTEPDQIRILSSVLLSN